MAREIWKVNVRLTFSLIDFGNNCQLRPGLQHESLHCPARIKMQAQLDPDSVVEKVEVRLSQLPSSADKGAMRINETWEVWSSAPTRLTSAGCDKD